MADVHITLRKGLCLTKLMWRHNTPFGKVSEDADFERINSKVSFI